jgi:PAS domain S-box-containing protein
MAIARQHSVDIAKLGGETAAVKQIEVLASATQVLLKDHDPVAMMASLCEMIAGHVEIDAYLAYSMDESGFTATLDAWAGIPEEALPALRRLEIDDALYGVSGSPPARRPGGSPSRVNDPKAVAMRRVGVRAYFCQALTVGGRCIGVLSVGGKSKNEFSTGDVGFISAMCGYAAMAKERLRLLLEIRRREEMLLRAQRAAKAGMWEIDLRSNQMTWSDAYYELFALDPRIEPSLGGWLARIHPDDRQYVKTQFERAIAEERDQNFEYRILLPDGTVRWVNRKGLIDRDEHGRAVRLSGITFDVTERKHGEEALRASEERWQLAINGSTDGMWDWDPRSNKVFLSSRWKALRGYSDDEIGDHVEERSSRIHQDDYERVMRTIQLYLAGKIPLYECEYRSRCRDGSYRWINDRGQAVWDEQGRVLRMVGSEVDISDRKRAEEALRKFNQELEQRVDQRTRELVRSQARLRALATELNLSEQRQRQRLSEDLHDYLAQLLVFVRLKLNQAKRSGLGLSSVQFIAEADSTLTQALTYTRSLIAELSPPVLRDFGLIVALQWLTDHMRRHEMTVSLERHVEEVPLPEEQAVLLFQSVRELLINVSKHAGTNRAVVSVGEANGMLCIEVKDQGRGFDLQEALLADNATSESSRYGLFSIRERMCAMGGDFDVDSAPGRGTTATLVLPLTGGGAGDVSSLEQPPRLSSFVSRISQANDASRDTLHDHHHSTLQKNAVIRVLLADDHAMVRQGLRSVLDAYADVEVVGVASDGEEALRLAQSLQPEIVVMDVNMPGVDGIEATRQLRQEQPTIAVIGLSVHNNLQVERAMREAGAAGFLTKESAVEQLYLAIQEALGQSG